MSGDNWDGQERRQENLSTQALVAQLAILNERLGNFIKHFESHVIADEKKFETHEFRITKLENWHMRVVGGLVVLSIVLQVINMRWNGWGISLSPKSAVAATTTNSQ